MVELQRAMDLLTQGYRTYKEVEALLGEGIAKTAMELLDDHYGYDHIPWYAKRWKPLEDDEVAKKRYGEQFK